MAAVIRHDLKHVLSVTDPDIEGCGWNGIEWFRTFITDSGGWDEVRTALQLGGVMRSSTEFESNYVMMTFPLEADRTVYQVVIKPNTPVHEKPDITSVTAGKLHYEIVIPVEKGKAWQKIEYRPGRVGYVRTSDLADPTGYSLGLKLLAGKWRIRWIGSYCD